MKTMTGTDTMDGRTTARPMRTRTKFIAAAAVIAVGIGWYLFRPELLFVNKSVNEGFPAAAAAGAPKNTESAVASGMFRGVAHETKGSATIHELADGKHVLRLTGFETSNGPDVRVYLVKAEDAKDNDTVTTAGFADLGSLKGNVGDQNYELPADLDLSQFHAVTIWCKRFGVNFGTAPLTGSEKPAAANPSPAAISAGKFHSVAHETKGTAAIHELANGRHVLRLTGFETSNGPDVHVYLVKAEDAKDNDTVTKGGFTDLGSLKGNVGDQNYELPADLDLSQYQAVTIWCKRFGVNFGTAPLAMK